MEKLEKKKMKTNNMAHLVSLIAIIALLLCLALVLCIRAVNKNKASANTDEELAKTVLSEDGEEMTVRLEEVQKDLETLESALNDSTTTMNTLYRSQDADKKAQIEESMKQMSTIEERLLGLKGNVSTLLETINSNEEYDTSVMLENFIKLYADLDKLKANTDDVLNSLIAVSGDNKNELKSVMDKMSNQLTSDINKTNDGLSKSIDETRSVIESTMNNNSAGLKKNLDETRTVLENTMTANNDGLKAYLDEIKAELSQRFNKVDADIDSVFQYVASGKRGLASALATIGTSVEMDAETGDYAIMTFEDIVEKIKHSQDISGTYMVGDEELLLTGTTPNNISLGAAAWVNGEYIVGNGQDVNNAYEQGYGRGYAEGLERANSARVVYTLGHVHTGGTVSSNSRNGCYESRYEQYTYTTTQHSCQTSDGSNGQIAGTTQYCNLCGKILSYYGGITGDPGNGCIPHDATGYRWVGYLVCGMNEGDEIRTTSDLSTMTSGEKIVRAEISFD